MTPGLRWVDGEFVIHRLPPDAVVVAKWFDHRYVTVSRTDEELSVVAPASLAVDSERSDPGWAMFVFDGVLDFGLTGVLVGVAAPLAEAEISIFAISTFDTDYVLVRANERDRTESILAAAGHNFIDR